MKDTTGVTPYRFIKSFLQGKGRTSMRKKIIFILLQFLSILLPCITFSETTEKTTPVLTRGTSSYFLDEQKLNLSNVNSYGLVIGINSYENMLDLNYSVNDARLLGNTLIKLGFQIPEGNILIKQSPNDPVLDRNAIIKNIRRVLEVAEEKDRVLIFYAGHGIETRYRFSRPEAYLVPSNANPDEITSQGIAFQGLVRLAELSSVKANLARVPHLEGWG